ncbi:MAG TPA: PorP/SprF family type IX secretion system membrane protein [Bacteroidales bacterium]|nr:PorP/SprF family type IX secretion system membrane protein [Bacteroidales bacterium]
MVIKKSIGVLFGCMVAWGSFSQDFHFSGFMQNMVYVNPAYAALPNSGEVGITYRNQWPGVPATFVTYGTALIMPVKTLSSGIGISFLNDIQGSGVISRTSATLLYGYVFDINSNWQVGAGINATYVFKQFNSDELTFRSDILNDLGYSYGPVTYGNYTKSYPDFGVGVIIKNNNNISFGVSVSHLTRPREAYSDLVNNRLPLKYTAFVSGRIPGSGQSSSSGLSAEPAIFYSRQQENQELIWGSQFLFNSGFILGGFLRHGLNMSMDAVIISAGISYEKYNIYYSYDVNLKKINFLSTKMAAHEVTFLYRFEYKDGYNQGGYKGKRSGKIDCPAY